MAHLHANHISIAASEQDMLSVLKVIAFNLATNHDVTNYDDFLEDCSTVKQAYDRVSDAIWTSYIYAFTPDRTVASEWLTFQWRNNRQKITSDPAYASISNVYGITTGSSILTGPFGRPMSDEAWGGMTQAGKTFVLQIHFDTKNESNIVDVTNLFAMLPAGDYGLAFLDTDLEDGWPYSLNCLAGNHPGAACLDVLDEISHDIYDAQTLFDYIQVVKSDDLSTETNLAKIALNLAATCSGLDLNSISNNKKLIDSFLLSYVQGFPKDLKFSGSNYSQTNQFIDELNLSSPLVMKSKYINADGSCDFDGFPFCSSVDIFDTNGHYLSHIYWHGDANNEDIRGLAYLTPYVIVTVKEVNPFSTSMSKRTTSEFVAHFELIPFDFNELLSSVHQRLDSPKDRQGRQSVVKEDC